jgi:prepilin peptidase CpaA
MVPVIFLLISLVALCMAATIDLRHRIVPNRLVIVIAACGVGLRLWSAPGLTGFSLLAAALIVIALGRLAYHEWIGGGDAKLIGAVTLLVPLSGVGMLLLNIAIAGGLLSCAYVAARYTVTASPVPQPCAADVHRGKLRLQRLLRGERRRIAGGEPMPYALAVLGGVIYRIISEAVQCLSATFCLL